MPAQQSGQAKAGRFLYVTGEKQSGIFPEDERIFTLGRQNLRQVESVELQAVIAGVFSGGQFFPGPDEALSAVVHELARRSKGYSRGKADAPEGRCTVISAFRLLNGKIPVRTAAVLPARPGQLDPEQPETFHDFFLEALPGIQKSFSGEPYAPDSRLVRLIQESTLHHVNKTLDQTEG